eukprot:89473-Amorphochlora_amoeboformis.AAC.2
MNWGRAIGVGLISDGIGHRDGVELELRFGWVEAGSNIGSGRPGVDKAAMTLPRVTRDLFMFADSF